jgi:predicted DNA-binding transcriptional regulator AlpA
MTEETFTTSFFEQLEQMVEAKVKTLMDSDRLWSHERIAVYLDCSVRRVQDYFSKLPDFPQAIKIKGGYPRYEPKEIKKWALSYKEKRAT